MHKVLTFFIAILSVLSAENNVTDISDIKEKEWGVGAVVRTATLPYIESEYTKDTTVSTLVPFLYYDDEAFYIHGTELGYRFYQTPSWDASALLRLRFTDLPSELQNDIQEDRYDPGVQFRYIIEKDHYVDLEAMSDYEGNYYLNAAYEKKFEFGDFELKPYVVGSYKSGKFNSKYYGLNTLDIGGGVDLSAGATVRYHLYDNLYLLGNLQTKFLSDAAANSPFVKERRQDEAFLGLGLFHNKNKPLREALDMQPFVKLAYGLGTPSNLNEILTGKKVKDEYDNSLASIFYGHPLTDNVFSFPIELYLTPGFVWHQSSEVQSNIPEYVVAIRAYYTFPTPWHVRFGVAEGVSYVDQITYIEESEMIRKEYRPSKLLNYLGFSLDLNLGDVFGEKLEGLWFGYDIHHRSAIFESASQFGRIKGGSNYTTLYLQYHYK